MPELTPEQVLALPAGAEVDRLIGLHVFGWEPTERRLYLRDPESGAELGIPADDEPCPSKGADFAPSRGIEHAWLVVDRMASLYPEDEFRLHASRPAGGPLWGCYFRSPRYGVGGVDDAPLAICRAALLCLCKE